MKKILVVMAMLLMLSSAAFAADYSWSGYLTYVLGSGDDAALTGTNIFVEVEANKQSPAGPWDWSYTLTPGAGVDDISIFSLSLTPFQLVSIPSGTIANTVGWAQSKTASSIQWVAGNAAKLGTGVGNIGSGKFTFTSSLTPSMLRIGRAQDGGQYNGFVPTPAVPEPMSIMLGALGLGVVSGLRRLRK